MKKLKTYNNRSVFWIDYNQLLEGKMPAKDWICLATASETKPDSEKFDKFTRNAIKNGLLEFKGHGTFGELLHDWFDETMSIIDVMENPSKIAIVTTWHNNESLANTFWECFFATSIPETADWNNLTIVCTDLDGKDRQKELEYYINLFLNHYLPND